MQEEAVAAALKLGFSETVKVRDVDKEYRRISKAIGRTSGGKPRVFGARLEALEKYEETLDYLNDFLLLGKNKLVEFERVFWGTLGDTLERMDELNELVPAALLAQRQLSMRPGSRAAIVA